MGTGRARKRSWKRWAAITASVVLLLAGAAWYAYTVMTDKLVEVLTDEAEQDSVGADSDEGAAAAAPPAARPADESQEREASPPGKHASSSGALRHRAPVPKPAAKAAKAANAGKDGDGQSSPKQPPQAAVPPEDVATAAHKATVKDRLAIGKVLLNHWDAADLKAMSGKLKGGLTVAEKRELKQEVMAKLTPEEYDKLAAIAKKLGLSRGKSYADSIREQRLRP